MPMQDRFRIHRDNKLLKINKDKMKAEMTYGKRMKVDLSADEGRRLRSDGAKGRAAIIENGRFVKYVAFEIAVSDMIMRSYKNKQPKLMDITWAPKGKFYRADKYGLILSSEADSMLREFRRIEYELKGHSSEKGMPLDAILTVEAHPLLKQDLNTSRGYAWDIRR